MIAAALSLLLSSPAQDVPRDPRAYRAIGTEPFWSVTIGADRMVFDDVEGNETVARKPRPRTINGITFYRTSAFSVAIRNMECSDGMSDRRYADSVRVRIGKRTLNGCGRAYPEPNTLDGSEWRIAALNGNAVEGPRPATLSFTADRISGSTGCNRLSGGYTLEMGRLSAPRLATTRMACAGDAMETERALLDLLDETVVAYPMRDGSIRLVGTGGKRADLVRVE